MRNILGMMLLAELMMAANEETKDTTSKAEETTPFGLTGEEIEKIAAKQDEVRKFLTEYGLKESEPKKLDAESVVLSLDELLQLKEHMDALKDLANDMKDQMVDWQELARVRGEKLTAIHKALKD